MLMRALHPSAQLLQICPPNFSYSLTGKRVQQELVTPENPAHQHKQGGRGATEGSSQRPAQRVSCQEL